MWWPFRRRRQYVLYAMRAADMVLCHPNTDWTKVCQRCGEPVGLYPASQEFLKRSGEANIEIVCTRCDQPQSMGVVTSSPAEIEESVKNQRLG